jgi:hypothetical protein
MKPEQCGQRTLCADKRKSARYLLSCPALYRWTLADGSSQDGLGTTRDVSGDGVFVLANRCPPLGVRIDLKINLPRPSGIGIGVRLNGEGRVLRVEEDGEGEMRGFAASVSFSPYSIEEDNPSRLSPGTKDVVRVTFTKEMS